MRVSWYPSVAIFRGHVRRAILFDKAPLTLIFDQGGERLRILESPYMETGAEQLRAMIDTNIFDAILEAPTSVALLNDLTNRGKLVIMVTHVQADEIAAMSEAKREKREALQNIAAELITTALPTSGAIWGVTKWGQGMYGDGTDELRIGDIMRSNPKDAQDALIAITAAARADVLVTNEEALPRRIRAKGATLEVLHFEQFMERARAL